MATHSSVLAWRIPEMGEPGGLPSMGSHRVGHGWSDLAAAAICFWILWDFETGVDLITIIQVSKKLKKIKNKKELNEILRGKEICMVQIQNKCIVHASYFYYFIIDYDYLLSDPLLLLCLLLILIIYSGLLRRYMKTNQMRKAKPVYSVLAIARKSVTITHILVNREAGSRLENLYSR